MQQLLSSPLQEVVTVEGLTFKDLNANGRLDPYEDWRLSPVERAADLVARMDLDELVGMMLINTRFTGSAPRAASADLHDGALDERTIEAGTSIFATRQVFGTTETIERLLRHFIVRDDGPAGSSPPGTTR